MRAVPALGARSETDLRLDRPWRGSERVNLAARSGTVPANIDWRNMVSGRPAFPSFVRPIVDGFVTRTMGTSTYKEALIEAAEAADLPRLQRLHAKGGKKWALTAPGHGGVCLIHITARLGHIDIMKWLIENGARKDQGTIAGAQPIHIAALNGQLEMVQYLHEEGVDLQACTAQGAQPIHLAAAAQNNGFTILKWLRQKVPD